jgi:hypothetical protein
MLIVRYYRNGGFAGVSSFCHSVLLVTLIPFSPGAADAPGAACAKPIPTAQSKKKPTCQDNSGGGIQLCLN